MPCRQVHEVVGTAGGVLYVAARTRQEPPLRQLVELVAAGVGGFCGGRLADQLEPATNGQHRRLAHSLAAGGSLLLATRTVDAFCDDLRQARPVLRGADGQQEPDRLGEVLCLLTAGFLAGLVVGYLSHLALDSLTPASLPVI